jgi:hypothetical protein
MLAQEAGDFGTAWLLTGAACNMCLALELHRKEDSSRGSSLSTSREAYYCFTLCYMHDKGLAMNLGQSPHLPDCMIEIDILKPPNRVEPSLDNFRIYLELAKIQSRINIDLRSTSTSTEQANLISGTLVKMDYIWALNNQVTERKSIGTEQYQMNQLTRSLVENQFPEIQQRQI